VDEELEFFDHELKGSHRRSLAAAAGEDSKFWARELKGSHRRRLAAVVVVEDAKLWER